MSKLISGKEVLISLANGDCVMCHNESTGHVVDVRYYSANDILNGGYEYRGEFFGLEFFIKPKTILFNGAEIPAPFKPKVGETFWYIRPAERDGYCCTEFKDLEFDNNAIQFGAWDSEDKIKEVVKAVRNVFNCGDNQC